MKNHVIIVLRLSVICLTVFIMSCSSSGNKVLFRSMVSDYCTPKELQIWPVDEKKEAMHILMDVSSRFGMDYPGTSTQYDYWCQKHEDMSYNRELEISKSYPINPHQFIAADYISIEITSNADWDDAHPAGTSLNDITMFYSVSPIKYIRSGYAEEFNWDTAACPWYFSEYVYNPVSPYKSSVAEGTTPFHPVMKRVSELTSEDMVLLGSGSVEKRATVGLIEFTSLPTNNRHHTITVVLITDDNKVFSGSLTMMFY